MNKLNQIALALAVLTFASCSKHVDATASPINAIPNIAPSVHDSKPAAPAVATWSGPGSLQMSGMPDATCATVTAVILEDANGFELQKFSYDCSGMSANMDAIRLDLRSGDLYQGTSKVGTKQDNTVQFELADPSGATVGFQFVNVNDTLQTKQTLKGNGFEQTLTATLKR